MLFLAFFQAFWAFTAHAFKLDPMVVNVPITSPKAAATYSVENNTKEKIALQFDIRERLIDENGKEERPPSSNFIIYPEQLALDPGEKRSVRLTWQADTMPDKELAFRFIATQLPVPFEGPDAPAGKKVSLKFLIEYVASLYLVPIKARSRMKVVGHKVSSKGELEVEVSNEGSAHFLLEGLALSAKSEGKTFVPSGKALQEARSQNILAGGRRLLKFPLPKDFPTKKIDLSVAFEQ